MGSERGAHAARPIDRDFPAWRELHAERLAESVQGLQAVEGVADLVLGGSVGRGQHWPLSDIDIIVVWRTGAVDRDALAAAQAAQVDWWAASGRAQTLDVGWLGFEVDEVRTAIETSDEGAARLMGDARWLHGTDKMFGGRGAIKEAGWAQSMASWATRVRFQPAMRAARESWWADTVLVARDRAAAARAVGDRDAATFALREAARGLRLVLCERWGERLGSMGREWTLWERAAVAKGEGRLARVLARLACATADDALNRAAQAPVWLRERVRLAYTGRRLIGEAVTEAESARDQVAAFAVHFAKRGAPPWPSWMRMPENNLEAGLAELDDVIGELGVVAPR